MSTPITLVAAAKYTYDQVTNGPGKPAQTIGATVDLGDASNIRISLVITESSKHPANISEIPQSQVMIDPQLQQPVGLNPGFFLDLQSSFDGTTWQHAATLIDDHDTDVATTNFVFGPLPRYVRAAFRIGGKDHNADAWVTFSLTGSAV